MARWKFVWAFAGPWLLALAGLVALELVYFAVVRPPRAAWNSFLDLRYERPESFQRLDACCGWLTLEFNFGRAPATFAAAMRRTVAFERIVSIRAR